MGKPSVRPSLCCVCAETSARGPRLYAGSISENPLNSPWLSTTATLRRRPRVSLLCTPILNMCLRLLPQPTHTHIQHNPQLSRIATVAIFDFTHKFTGQRARTEGWARIVFSFTPRATDVLTGSFNYDNKITVDTKKSDGFVRAPPPPPPPWLLGNQPRLHIFTMGTRQLEQPLCVLAGLYCSRALLY